MVTDPKSTPQPGEERGCLVIEWESSSSPLEVSLEVSCCSGKYFCLLAMPRQQKLEGNAFDRKFDSNDASGVILL
jgi:hypothetical protein